MKTALIGLGAVGTVIATRIEQTNPQTLSIIADPKRRTKLITNGISLNGRRYDFNMPEVPSPQELVIVTIKSPSLDQVIESISPWIGPKTIILPLLNGITPVELFAERYGWERVLRGFYLGHTTAREGQSVTHDGHYYLYFGCDPKHAAMQTEMVERVAAYFDQVGVPYKRPENMLTAQWQKYILNIGTNQSSALLRCDYGTMQSDPRAWDLALNLMREAQEVAIALHIPEADQLLDRAVNSIRNMVPEHKSSMLQDVEAGRTTEIDLFAGTLCRLGQQLGIETPTNNRILLNFNKQ